MDGLIETVMESWPLQLSIHVGAGKERVILSETVIVKRGAARLDPGALRPGQRVRLTLRPSSGASRIADIIEIVE